MFIFFFFFFSSRRRHTRWPRDWSSDVCSSDLVYRGFSGVPYLVSGNVRLDLRAGYTHTEYEDPQRIVESSSSSKIDVVISDQERSGDILWLSRVRWHRYAGARNDIDSLAATKQWL